MAGEHRAPAVDEPMTPDPLQIRDRLAVLFDRAVTRPGMSTEITRARRDFFGDEQPDYVVDETALDAAAQRFAEWFLLERESEVLGEVPVRVLDTDDDEDLLGETRQGLFLVESRAEDGAWLRDLEGGERLRAAGLDRPLQPGDLLVGRLFGDGGEFLVPSFGATVVGGAAHLAVAFQRDMRAQELGRRLDQVEVEHLVHRRLGLQSLRAAGQDPSMTPPGPEVQSDIRPVEHIEAELQALFDAAGDVPEPFTATNVSSTLRAHTDQPGGVVGPLLDHLAFGSDVDLERLRQLLLELWHAHRHQPSDLLDAAASAPPAPPPRPTAPRPARPGKAGFVPQPGESLGETLARRIEQGISDHEAVGDLFADVERLFGEEIGDEDDDGARQVGPELGDLDAWVREFAWEAGLDGADEHRLQQLAAHLREAPVPRMDVESIEADDLLRFLLRLWLESSPDRRVAELRAVEGLLARFLDWVADSQLVDIRERLQPARDLLLVGLERCTQAGQALSDAPAPRVGAGDAGRLLRVADIGPAALHVVEPGGDAEVQLAVASAGSEQLELGDLLITELRELRDGRARPGEYVVVLPGAVERFVTG